MPKPLNLAMQTPFTTKEARRFRSILEPQTAHSRAPEPGRGAGTPRAGADGAALPQSARNYYFILEGCGRDRSSRRAPAGRAGTTTIMNSTRGVAYDAATEPLQVTVLPETRRTITLAYLFH